MTASQMSGMRYVPSLGLSLSSWGVAIHKREMSLVVRLPKIPTQTTISVLCALSFAPFTSRVINHAWQKKEEKKCLTPVLEKTGILRVREAIESNDWDQLEESQMSDFGDFENAFGKLEDENEADDGDFNPESLEFGVDRSDFEGLRAAIWNVSHNEDKQESINPDEDGGTKAPARAGHPAETETEPEPEAKPGMDGKANNAGKAGSSGADKYDCRDGNTYLDDEDVAKVERLMRKLQAAREIGEGMSETQRKRLAARAVEDVMKEL